jgi:hypothetical protein
MTDAFNREIEKGDIVVRIFDWGSCDLCIVESQTPAGYFRTIAYYELMVNDEEQDEGQFQSAYLLKNGSNLIILDENLLALYLGEAKAHQVQIYLEQSQLMKAE